MCICIIISVIVVNEWWYFLPYCYITGDAATLALWTVNEGGQSKLEACAQMSRCCFHNSLFVLTFILHNKTLSTFIKMCKYLSRNRKKLVEKVLEGHNWFYWYGHWARLELCISCSGPEMKSWIQDLVLIRTKWPDWFWQSPDFQMYWVPSWYFKVPILDVQGPHWSWEQC